MNVNGDELYDVIAQVYDKYRHLPSVSPVLLAEDGMRMIRFHQRLHTLGWIGCNLHLREVARVFCRRNFSIRKPIDEDGNDLFPETLQERYPIRPRAGEERQYVLLDHLSDDDMLYNIDKLGKFVRGYQKHKDALQAHFNHRVKQRADEAARKAEAADAEAMADA